MLPAGEGPAGDYTIIRRFEFSAEKQRNVVVVRKPDATLWVYAKGSPEMICRLAGGHRAERCAISPSVSRCCRVCPCGWQAPCSPYSPTPSVHLQFTLGRLYCNPGTVRR